MYDKANLFNCDELSDRSAMVFSKDEYQSRIHRLDKTMQDLGVDVYMGSTPENMNYFAGFDSLGLYFYQQIFFASGSSQPSLLTHKCEKELARTQCWIEDISIWEHGDNPLQMTIDKLLELGVTKGRRVGLELGNWYLKADTYKFLVDAMPDVDFVDVTEDVLRLRTIKSSAEIQYMREAAKFSDIGFSAAVGALRSGVTEVEILASIQYAMSSAGSEYPTLPFIIGSGPRSGLFHGVPTVRAIQEGDPVMLEITGSAKRYNSNIVRTVVSGKATPALKDMWEIVNEAFWRPFELIKPGTSVSELDRLSRELRVKFNDYIPARAGFSMGLAYPPVWAGRPDILVGDDEILQEGMVFSLEPSIAQFQGTTVIFGYNILVTENGAEILQSTSKDIFEI